MYSFNGVERLEESLQLLLFATCTDRNVGGLAEGKVTPSKTPGDLHQMQQGMQSHESKEERGRGKWVLLLLLLVVL